MDKWPAGSPMQVMIEAAMAAGNGLLSEMAEQQLRDCLVSLLIDRTSEELRRRRTERVTKEAEAEVKEFRKTHRVTPEMGWQMAAVIEYATAEGKKISLEEAWKYASEFKWSSQFKWREIDAK